MTENGSGITTSGVMPMVNAGIDPDEVLMHAARNVRKDIIITGDAVSEWGDDRENLLLAGAHPALFPNARGMPEDSNRAFHKFSRSNYYRKLFNQSNRQWARDLSFIFNIKDMQDRVDAFKFAKIRLKNYHHIPGKLRSPEVLQQVLGQLAKGEKLQTLKMKSPGLLPLLRNIKIVGGMIRGTPIQRIADSLCRST